MPKLEEVYKRLEENKQKRKEMSKMLKDELGADPRHKAITEEMATLRDEKKGIEQNVLARSGQFSDFEELKIEIATDQELLADIALNMFTNNETVEIVDEYEQTLHPVFKVSFKKSNS